jgi:zinc protease
LDQLLLSDVAPLRRDLVEDRGLAYDIGGADYRFRDPHLFLIWAELKPQTDFDSVLAAIELQVQAVGEGVDPAQLDAVKARASKEFRLGLDDPQSVANAIGHFTAFDPDPQAVDAWFAALQAVTAEDLQGIVATYFVLQGQNQTRLMTEPSE